MQSSKDPEPSKADADTAARDVAPATLYLVATPIGNLGDIGRRALAILEQADVLLAEDTRRTRKLLASAGIRRRMEAHHQHNEHQRTAGVIERLLAGASVALVSDAGTPGIADPGFRIARAAIDAGIRVVPVPGACAPIAALVGSGLPADRFFFVGYPPRKRGERDRFLATLTDLPATLVMLESPRRAKTTLAAIAEILGASRQAAVARELTKAHEEYIRGSVADILERLRDVEIRGEITVCVGSAEPPETDPDIDGLQLRDRYTALVEEGLDRRGALRRLAADTGLSRRQVYRRLLDTNPEPEPGDES